MSKLTLITSTGNAQTDKIFKGVFGAIDANGDFDVADELKGIHLFALLTPQGLKEQGIDLTSSVVELEVADADMGAVKATLLSALKDNWLQMYDAAQVPAGIARAALNAERTSVQRAVDKALDTINVQPKTVVLEAAFSNQTSKFACFDAEEEDDYGVLSSYVNASEIVDRAPWQIAPAVEQATLDALSDRAANSDGAMNFTSGRLVSPTVIYGDNPAAVIDFINSLPLELTQLLSVGKDARFVDIEWHEHRREPQDTLNEVLTLPAPMPSAGEPIPAAGESVAGEDEVGEAGTAEDDFSHPAPTA